MINVFSSCIGDEELESLRLSFQNSWMGAGPRVEQFEKEFSNHLNLPGFAMTDSGSNALYLAIQLLDLPPNSKIIVPSFTWVACANAVVLSGHIPIFADVDLETCNITNKTISEVISTDTKAIMIVHYAGLPVEKISFGLPIIEDNAHAVNSKVDGISCGNFGNVSIFSFDAIKNISTPEGGGVAAQPTLIAKAKEYRYCGISDSGFSASQSVKNRWWEHDIVRISPKMMPNDISASIALTQLHKLPMLQARRKFIWETYQREFKGLDWLILPPDPPKNVQHSYFTYFVRLKNRDQLARYLLDNNVYTTLRYRPLHLNAIYNYTRKLPNCELLSEQGLNLPIHPQLSDNDIDKVISLVKGWQK